MCAHEVIFNLMSRSVKKKLTTRWHNKSNRLEFSTCAVSIANVWNCTIFLSFSSLLLSNMLEIKKGLKKHSGLLSAFAVHQQTLTWHEANFASACCTQWHDSWVNAMLEWNWDICVLWTWFSRLSVHWSGWNCSTSHTITSHCAVCRQCKSWEPLKCPESNVFHLFSLMSMWQQCGNQIVNNVNSIRNCYVF